MTTLNDKRDSISMFVNNKLACQYRYIMLCRGKLFCLQVKTDISVLYNVTRLSQFILVEELEIVQIKQYAGTSVLTKRNESLSV